MGKNSGRGFELAILKTEGTVFPRRDRTKPVVNLFKCFYFNIFTARERKRERNILLQNPWVYMCTSNGESL